MKTVFIEPNSGLPKDCHVVNARWNVDLHCIDLVVAHPSFPVVKEGCFIPEVQINAILNTDDAIRGSLRGFNLREFQQRVVEWLKACFGEDIATDTVERRHRFGEEALELFQACGGTKDEALQLVDYVFDRPIGEPTQEVGGVMTTLMALCFANGFDAYDCATTELDRVWQKIEKIRAKQAAKPKLSVLPVAVEKPKLTDGEIEYLLSTPESLEVLAHYHDCQSAQASAMGYDEAAKHHEQQWRDYNKAWVQAFDRIQRGD